MKVSVQVSKGLQWEGGKKQRETCVLGALLELMFVLNQVLEKVGVFAGFPV